MEREKNDVQKVDVFIERDGERIVAKSSVPETTKIVIVINNQFTSTPNTTQIASGAGRNSTAGNNAAIDSSNTEQQQSVGAEGEAKNFGLNGDQQEPHEKHGSWKDDEEGIVIVINNQINRSEETAGATQVASGSGTDSAAGTNAAVASSNTKQQHAVGGDGIAVNDGENGDQEEV
ncbi:hypothetical protein [Bacillus sp. PK3_68]|uniref:hypothetical protein n=1 Tax=Bacillus sp. PK3_68 TaxID=2027408 RepID=UPI000E764BAC|nr:hypothetical protein [Bacillus sp. PK3_68]RJS62499.1 hypothetical protein CJ483_08250 [Bacillus sp. PK3_68]